MGFCKDPCYGLVFYVFIGFCLTSQCFGDEVYAYQPAKLLVNASDAAGRPIPETLFGIFFEVCSLSYYSFPLGSLDVFLTFKHSCFYGRCNLSARL